jgi:hypothetical protein
MHVESPHCATTNHLDPALQTLEANFSRTHLWPTTQQHSTSVMNNQQFRRLLIDTPKQQPRDGDEGKTPAARTPGTVLGARKVSSIPMTPYVSAPLRASRAC